MNEFEGRLIIPDGNTSISYAAQAGFVIKSKTGTTLAVDLYLSDCVERFDGFKRMSPKVMNPSTPLDFIVASHWHLDHFDIDAMPFLLSNQKTKLICCEDCVKHVKSLNLNEKKVTYIKQGETLTCNDIIIHAVHCDHGKAAPLAVGFVFEVDGYKIYFTGDTALRLDMAMEIIKYSPIDVMIAPINGAFGNLNEYENVKLCSYIKPKLSIPCHFWTFIEHHGDPGVWVDEMKRELPEQKYYIMTPGEQLALDLVL